MECLLMKEMKHKTGPKLGTGGKRNKLRICLTADVEAFWKRNGDTLGEAIETSTRKSAAFKRWLTRDV
jgi:hypothetical protein